MEKTKRYVAVFKSVVSKVSNKIAELDATNLEDAKKEAQFLYGDRLIEVREKN